MAVKGMVRGDNIKLVVIATICLLVGLSAPAIGHGVHARFAHNADKVDGKHAVEAGASTVKRKGKLVATNGTSGRLPNNIIAKAPDADRLDGIHATGLVRAARMKTDASLALTTTDQTYGPVLSITAPRDGFVLVNGNVTLAVDAVCNPCHGAGRIRHIQSNAHSTYMHASVARPDYGGMSMSWVFPVSAGVNTFDFRLSRTPGDGTLYGWYGEMTALFVPFGPTGGSTFDPRTRPAPKQATR